MLDVETNPWLSYHYGTISAIFAGKYHQQYTVSNCRFLYQNTHSRTHEIFRQITFHTKYNFLECSVWGFTIFLVNPAWTYEKLYKWSRPFSQGKLWIAIICLCNGTSCWKYTWCMFNAACKHTLWMPSVNLKLSNDWSKTQHRTNIH